MVSIVYITFLSFPSKRAREEYHKVKAINEAEKNGARLTRTSLLTATPPPPKCICEACQAGKKPREMTKEEKRLHENAMRKRLYDQRSSQKKTADK